MLLKTPIQRWKLIALTLVPIAAALAVFSIRHHTPTPTVVTETLTMTPQGLVKTAGAEQPVVTGAVNAALADPVAAPASAADVQPVVTTDASSVAAAIEDPQAPPSPTIASPRRQSGVVTPAPVAAVKPFSEADRQLKLPVNARHVLVVDDGGRVLMAKDADTVVPIASLSKLMTAMVILDAKQDMKEQLTIDDADVDRLKHSASRVRVGATMTRAAALELALLASENRAASALARAYPGGLAAFESAVLAKTRALGLMHTALLDPTGLSPDNTSTATEVARIAMAAARYRQITDITSDAKSRVVVNGKPRELRNTNHLVGGKGWDIRLSKTGYTNEAGRCLAMRMHSGGQTLTVILLDADGSAQRLRDAALIRKSLNKQQPA